jgi:hypothetical protein
MNRRPFTDKVAAMERLALSHYSEDPLDFDPSRSYDQGDFGNGKPRGLWLSVDGPRDWPEWCRGEDWAIESLANRAPFALAAGANVLVISTEAELIGFTLLFRGQGIGRRWIDWSLVARQYDGLIIAPYIWPSRLNPETIWYYGWDCASGCIWNLSALELVS